MTRNDLERRLEGLESERGMSDDRDSVTIRNVAIDEDGESDGSDTLADAIKKAYWERRDDADEDQRETVREWVARATRRELVCDVVVESGRGSIE